MKTLYIDCGMGAAGDMLTAALLELLPDSNAFVDELNKLGIPGVTFEAAEAEKCGIKGTHMTVKVHGVEEGEEHEHHHEHTHEHDHHEEAHSHHDHEEIHEHSHDHEHSHEHDHHVEAHSHHDHEETHEHSHAHHHSSLHDIEHIVEKLAVSDKVKEDVMAVYRLIAGAESHAHGRPVTEIHFHEVGTMDAVADVTAVCLLMEKLSPDQVFASPVHVGCGQVKCAHGILPVPAPATAFILKDVPIYGGEIKGELCTPTGAALLKYFVTKFGSMPIMRVSSVGYGMGKKDFSRANCVRVLYGETMQDGNPLNASETDGIPANETMVELECNLDDITGEALGFAEERLFEAGARDVFTIPVQMKKSRPGILLSVICSEADKEKLIEAVFANTTTIGIREKKINRYVLTRREEVIETKYGPVRKKISEGYGVRREKYEYEDIASVARERGISVQDVLDGLK